MAKEETGKKKWKKNKNYMNQYIDQPENLAQSEVGDSEINRGDHHSDVETFNYSVYLNNGQSIDVQAEACEIDRGSGTLTFRVDGKIQYVFSPHYFIYCARAH